MSKTKKLRDKHKNSGAMAKWREKASGEDFGTLFKVPNNMKHFDIKAAGTYLLDIIPYVSKKGNEYVDAGEQWWEKTFFVHRNIGVNNDWVVCPAKTFKNKPCPICEFKAKLDSDPEADPKTIDALKASKRILTNCIDMKHDAKEVKLWHIAHWFFGKALKTALDAAYEDHEDNMDEFYKPEGGSYLKCTASEAEGGFSGYNVVRVDFKTRKEDLTDEILEQAADLDDILVVKSYDELKEMLMASKPDEDEDEDEKPKSKKDKKKEEKKSSKKSNKKDEDDDEDGDSGDDDEDEDVDVDEEEWDDSDDDDSDDDDSDDDDSDDDDSDDDDSDDDDSDDDDSDDDDEEEEEEEKPKKKRKK